MDRGRNTGGLAHEWSHRCSVVYLELYLQATLHHPMVLLGSFPQRMLYCHPMHQWGTALWVVWVWGSDTGCGVLDLKVLLFCGLDCSISARVLAVAFTVSHRTSSLELVNTNWWHVNLQCLCLWVEFSSCCSGVVGDCQKFAQLKDKSYTMETW